MRTVEITENTRFPLRLVIAFLGGVAGGAAWLTAISLEQRGQANQISRVETKAETTENHMSQIKTDVEVIKNDVHYIRQAIENKNSQ